MDEQIDPNKAAHYLQNAATRRELAEGVYATFGGKADTIGALA